MASIFRRSWEKQVFGRNGAISSVLPSRTGTDLAFAGSPTWTTPTNVVTSVTAAFVSTDVGRLIRIGAPGGSSANGTPNHRYDGYYIMDVLGESLAFSAGSGTFAKGETVTWSGGSAIVLQATSTTPLLISAHTGSAPSGTVTGGTSGATATAGALTTGTVMTLRKNHNIFNHPGSPAQFGESGSSIFWRISESCTFTADAAGDFNQSYHPGTYINIEGSANAQNNGLWRFSHFLTTQTAILCKSYVWYAADTQTYAHFTSDDNLSFTSDTGLQWSMTDREPFNGADSMECAIQAAIDAGWALWQQRGPLVAANTTQNLLADTILRSVGETDASLPNNKIMYVRFMVMGQTRTTQGKYTQVGVFMGMGHAYDRTQTPGTLPGQGIGFGRGQSGTSPPINTWNMTSISLPTTTADLLSDGEIGAGGCDLLSPGRGGQAFRYFRRDFIAWGDADEFHIVHNANPGAATSSHYLGWGAIKPIGQNPYATALNAVTTGGAVASKTFNTGTVDLSTHNYVVGDRISVRGQKVAATSEYMEPGNITAFGGSNPNFTVTATSIAATWQTDYGNFSDQGILGFVGNDPFPVAVYGYSSSTAVPVARLHNFSNAQDATGRDVVVASLGVDANVTTIIGSWTDAAPNNRSANVGLSAFHIRYDTGIEYRGRSRNIYMVRGDLLPLGKKMLDAVNAQVYVTVGWFGNIGGVNTTAMVAGPFSKTQAAVK